MNLDDAIGVVAQRRLRLNRLRRAPGTLPQEREMLKREIAGLSLVMWAAKEKLDRERMDAELERDRVEMAAIFKEPYAPKPKPVGNGFMFECPGCGQIFGRGKGPYGLARHCCHPSHPQMRRAR